MIVRKIVMGNDIRYVVKENDVSLLLNVEESNIFEELKSKKEQLNFFQTLCEARKQGKNKNFRIVFKLPGDEKEHHKVEKAVDEKTAVSAIHNAGGTVLSVQIVSDQETHRKPRSVIGEMFTSFKNFKLKKI